MTVVAEVPVMRAVYCACCGDPTGEQIESGKSPEHLYCRNCRDLPPLWDDNGNRVGGAIVNPHIPIDQRAQPVTAPVPTVAPPLRVNTPAIPPEDDEDERHPHGCPNCGGTEYEVDVHWTYAEGGTTTAYADMYDLDPDDTPAVYTDDVYPPEDGGYGEWEFDYAERHARCANCGQQADHVQVD